MPVELVDCGEHPPGLGGDFERVCVQGLRDQLPDGYLIATNVSLARGAGAFYECDVVIVAPGVCDILEFKCVRPIVDVHEDLITSSFDYSSDRIFSILDTKAKVLKTRLRRSPFPQAALHLQTYVNTMVVVPNETIINIRHEPYRSTKPLLKVDDVVQHYQKLAVGNSEFRNSTAFRELRNGWNAYRDSAARSSRRTNQYLGKYRIRRQVNSHSSSYEYWAIDEHPVQFDVHLREFPFDPTLSREQLEAHLGYVAREMRILRRVRHPDIACVTDHFQTGASWVQVSDWFEGECLDDAWSSLAGSGIEQRLGVFLRIVRALQFCHERGVFHRNVSAAALRFSDDFSQVRLAGFEFARDLTHGSGNTTTTRLGVRNPRIVPPEELTVGSPTNPRLSDIFQMGVLLYRFLERGAWPFSDTFDYATAPDGLRPFEDAPDSIEMALRPLAVQMMAVEPSARPDILDKVADEVAKAIARGQMETTP